MSKNATKHFLNSQIADAVTKALGLPISDLTVDAGKVTMVLEIAGEGAQNLFWQAVLEQADE